MLTEGRTGVSGFRVRCPYQLDHRAAEGFEIGGRPTRIRTETEAVMSDRLLPLSYRTRSDWMVTAVGDCDHPIRAFADTSKGSD